MSGRRPASAGLNADPGRVASSRCGTRRHRHPCGHPRSARRAAGLNPRIARKIAHEAVEVAIGASLRADAISSASGTPCAPAGIVHPASAKPRRSPRRQIVILARPSPLPPPQRVSCALLAGAHRVAQAQRHRTGRQATGQAATCAAPSGRHQTSGPCGVWPRTPRPVLTAEAVTAQGERMPSS